MFEKKVVENITTHILYSITPPQQKLCCLWENVDKYGTAGRATDDFLSVINQLDAQNFCFTVSLFHASTCFEHMCSKHVEAWKKLIVKQKLCASGWLITEMHSQQNVKRWFPIGYLGLQTRTQNKYVILILVLHGNNGYTNAQCCTYIACLVFMSHKLFIWQPLELCPLGWLYHHHHHPRYMSDYLSAIKTYRADMFKKRFSICEFHDVHHLHFINASCK